jgi:sec-independent protein translocase protein TatA
MGLDNPLHIAFLVVILLLVFGARRLPEIGRSLGGGLREFKQSINGESHEPEQPKLPTATSQPAVQTPGQPPVPTPAQPPVQTPAPASVQTPARDAFAQRDPSSTDQR